MGRERLGGMSGEMNKMHIGRLGWRRVDEYPKMVGPVWVGSGLAVFPEETEWEVSRRLLEG